MLRWLNNLDEFGFGEVLLLAQNARRHEFAVDREGYEDSLAAVAPDAIAAEGNVSDLKLDPAHAGL
jgi:hypothetical protein